MHFHLPKPLHGWRSFAGEVGIIVIGVLIALGAEQVAQAIHDRQVAQETRESIKQDIEGALAELQLRNSAEPCIARRLAEIRGLVDDWGRTGTFKKPLWIAQAPFVTDPLARYDAAEAAGRLVLLSREEQFRDARLVAGLRNYGHSQVEETQIWAKLRMLQSGADVLSPSDRTVIRTALEDAATYDYLTRLKLHQLIPMGAEIGFHPDMSHFREMAWRVWRNGRYTPSICVSIDTPPAQANEQSGQAVPLPE